MHSFQTNLIFNNTSQNLIYTASPRQGQTQLQDRGVKYSSQSYKSTASNIILTPRQQRSLSPVITQPRHVQTQLQDRGVKYSSQSYKSTTSNIILKPRQQQSLSPLPTPTPRRQQQSLSPVLTQSRQQQSLSPQPTPTPRRLQEPLSPLLTPTPRQQRSRSPLLTPPRHDENALQLQVNIQEVRVAQQANELNDLSTIQAYPTEYVSSLFDIKAFYNIKFHDRCTVTLTCCLFMDVILKNMP